MAENLRFTLGYFFSKAVLIALNAASDESALDTAMLRVPLGVALELVLPDPPLEHPARTAMTVAADATARMRPSVGRRRVKRLPGVVCDTVNSFVQHCWGASAETFRFFDANTESPKRFGKIENERTFAFSRGKEYVHGASGDDRRCCEARGRRHQLRIECPQRPARGVGSDQDASAGSRR